MKPIQEQLLEELSRLTFEQGLEINKLTSIMRENASSLNIIAEALVILERDRQDLHTQINTLSSEIAELKQRKCDPLIGQPLTKTFTTTVSPDYSVKG